jgi:UDP-N-acetylglucosamine 2-epimerase (non-hydrolysing)
MNAAARGWIVIGMSEARLRVVIVVGTRPEAIKLVPLILALRESETLKPVVVSSGQHHAMVQEVLALAGIAPDVDLWVGTRHSSLNSRVAAFMRRFEDYLSTTFAGVDGERATREQVLAGSFPAAVLVHGDTSSAFAAALAAFHLRIGVGHVEAGLRTGGYNFSPFPEELNRQLISCIAAVNFAPTADNEENLVREDIPANQIYVCGNTGIDALQWAAGLDVPFDDPRLGELVEGDARIVVVTAHRRENWGDGLQGIAEGIARLAGDRPELRFVLPLHPNPRVRSDLRPALDPLENVLLTEPLRYTTMARLLARCDLVITDSGGLQEEAPSLGKPVLVARDSTERTEGVDAGTLRIVGTDPDRIVGEAARLLDDPVAYATMANAGNPYGDGRAAERIVAQLEHMVTGANPPAPFGSGYSRSAILKALGADGWLEPLPEPDADERWEEHLSAARDT